MKKEDLKGLYIAHRGIHNDEIIENTISAFSLALDKKVPIEFDLQLLKDGSIVVYHDDNLKRIVGIDRSISSYNYEELESLTISNTEDKISLFVDVLKLVKGKVMLVIEVKRTKITSYQEYCRKIVSILEQYPYDFVIKSFDIRIVSWFLKNTDYITGLLMIKRKNSLYDFIINKRITLSILKPDFISVDYHIVGNELIQNFRKKKPVLVWTIRDRETLNKVKKWGDSYLIENFYF